MREWLRVASAAHRPLLLGGDIGRERGLLNPAIQGLDIRVKGSVGDTLKERPIAGKGEDNDRQWHCDRDQCQDDDQ